MPTIPYRKTNFDLPSDWDAITLEHLRSIGGAKWSRFPEHIGAFIAEMDFGMAPEIATGLHEYINSLHHGYQTAPLPDDTAKAFAGFYEYKYGVQLNWQRVLHTTDVLAAMEQIVTYHTPTQSPIIVPSPGYMCFFSTLRGLNREIIEIPLLADERWAMDLEALDAAFKRGGSMLILCNPHNPTGRVYTRSELEAICEVVASNNGLVFADEIHSPLTMPGFTHIPYESINEVAQAHTYSSTSVSKAWNLPGFRAAQIVMPTVKAAEEVKNSPLDKLRERVSNAGLVATMTAYCEAREWVSTVTNYIDRNQRWLADNLSQAVPGLTFSPNEGTYLAWIDASALGQANPQQFIKDKAGVMLNDGRDLGTGYDQFIRLNMATPLPILQTIVQQISEAQKAA